MNLVIFVIGLGTIWCPNSVKAANETSHAIERIMAPCRRSSSDFDACMQRAFNKLRPFFRTGIPEMGVAPFDPHFCKQVRQTRGGPALNYELLLNDVSEHGWSQSTVTKYKTDWKNERIVYSQYFPEKWLKGTYKYKGNALGASMLRGGTWNLTLKDYSQTTRIWKRGSGVVVKVEVDHIGGMDIHVGNLLRGSSFLESILDSIINATWKPGFAVIRPLINELVSTAFTDIWSQSFKNFPIDHFIKT